MAAVLESYVGLDEETSRAQQLANARKKLKSFRATRSSDHETASSSSSTSRCSFNAAVPLTSDNTFNVSTSSIPPHDYDVSKGFDLPPLPEQPRSPGKLRKSRGNGSMSHRRQNSSISGHGLTRGSVVGLFESDQLDAKPMRAEVPRMSPSEVNAAAAVPLLDASAMSYAPPPEDHAAVKSRLTAFSFGSKAPTSARSPSPRARRGQPLLPSQLHSAEASPSPEISPVKRGSMSTPLSRPPSLLLARPTPLAFGSPSPAGQARQLEPPSTPPTPARSKRHSHTRSNSISMPDLRLTSRPNSLGIPNSPSFPSSPSSPSMMSRPSSTQGTRLKFEPSGRGAEAEKEKEEYRRKALEKLTGSPTPSPLLPESPGHEIALPELDDEDGSSVASSARPFSGFGSFNFGRPSSSSSTPPGMSWPNNEDSPPLDSWSTGFNVKADDQDDALGSFGFTFSGNGSGSFSFGAAPPPYPPVEASIGLGLPSNVPARPSLTRNLSVLAEVDEPEDGEYDGTSDPFTAPPEVASVPFSPTADDLDNAVNAYHAPVVAPTPSRLRELHLVSASHASPKTVNSDSPLRSNSPTKGYGTIGRGRPAPISVHHTFDSPSVVATNSTPKSAGGPRRRPTSGSRGSSISYKKDGDSTSSSRDWSMSSSKAFFSPPTSSAEIASPPAQPNFAPSFAAMSNPSRPALARPCPRPKSLAGLGFDNQGAGRVLGELEEVDEDGLSLRNPSTRVASDDAPNSAGLSDILHESFGAGRADHEWETSHMELEMERDALQEDVDLWRKRCNGLEERLELEKKENGILRDRVRKLGDRWSSIVSYPAARSDASLVADLRTQLFGVKAELERERNAKLSACDRVAELEAQLASFKVSQLSTPSPVITNIIPPTPMSPDPEDLYEDAPSNPASPSTEHSPTPDPSTQRMRAWGFPRESAKASQPRNRESFFGLSQVLRPGSIYGGKDDAIGGIDLPPIDFMTAGVDVPGLRTVSDPMPKTAEVDSTTEKAAPRTSSDSAQRSTSLTSSASSALSFFTGYLPSRAKSPPIAAQHGSIGGFRIDQHVVQRLPSSEDKGNVDFRGGCKCCTGHVIEL